MTEKQFRPVVGIDLGTTNSSVARIFQGEPEIIPSENGDKLLPSVLHISEQGEIIVGKDACSALVAMPERTVAEVKRKMGTEQPIEIANRELLPEEISSLILKELMGYVNRIYGDEGEKEAVITVPAYFTDRQRRVTKKAGELAGFAVERIINEPTAAAMAYGLDKVDDESHILVYDLGGGTFDVSIVEMMNGVLEVKATTGNHQLGGSDFDWKLVNFFADKFREEYDIDPREEPQACAILKEEAEATKIKLSQEREVKVSISSVMVRDNQPLGLDIVVMRDDFVALIDDMLQATINSVSRVLEDANLNSGDIDEVLLVGGSTKIPRVLELLTDYFEKEPYHDINPEETVALGAAVQAGLKSGSLDDSGLIVTDVAPYSMGIEVIKGWQGIMYRPGGFSVIIPRNTTIPVTKTERFYTSHDGQTEVSIDIYQGEGEWVSENHLLGDFVLEGIPANRAGQEEIDVTFSYNLNGILEVTAKCVSTGEEMSITVQDALERDSQAAYEESLDRLEEFLDNAARAREEEEDKILLDPEENVGDTIETEIEDEYRNLKSLLGEAELLKHRVQDLVEDEEKNVRVKGEYIILKLTEAIESEDEERLENAINIAFEELMELESREV